MTIWQQDFWDDEMGDLWDDVAATLVDIYFDGLTGGVNALPPAMRVLVDWDLINTNALEFAKEYKYSWISKITDTTRLQTQKAVSDWIRSGAPLDALEGTLEKIYGPVRAEMIAQTETTRIFQTANSDAWQSTGVVEQMRYNTVVDDAVCPICSPDNGKVFDIGDFDHTPPKHIRCRCFTTPVVSKEALAKKLDTILA